MEKQVYLNKKGKLRIMYSLVLALVMLLMIFLSAQTTRSVSEAFTITEHTDYDITSNTVYVNIRENLGKNQVINVSSIFPDQNILDKLNFNDLYVNWSYDYLLYQIQNVSIGKYQTTNITIYTNGSLNITNYFNNQGARMNCDSVLPDRTCYVLTNVNYLNETRYTYQSMQVLAQRYGLNLTKLQSRYSGIPLQRNSEVQLRYTYSHPIALPSNIPSVENNKYNISVTSADGLDYAVLDPTLFNGSWGNCWEKKIDERSGIDQYNYSVYMNLTYQTGMMSNFSDIRIVSADNITLINHWKLNYTSGINAYIFTKIPFLANNTNTTVYVCFNKSDASESSNIKTAFIFGDDFNDNSLDATMWGSSNIVTEANGWLNVTSTGTQSRAYTTSQFNISKFEMVGRRMKKAITGNGQFFTYYNSTSPRAGANCFTMQHNAGTEVFLVYSSTCGQAIYKNSPRPTDSLDVFYIHRLRVNQTEVDFDLGTGLQENASFQSIDQTVLAPTSPPIGQSRNTIEVYVDQSGGGSDIYDYIYLRPYITPEPVVYDGLFMSETPAVVPQVNLTFNTQIPADISTTNLLNGILNISYNFTNTSTDYWNSATIKLWTKVNTTTSDCSGSFNGTPKCGYVEWGYLNSTGNLSNTFYFRLDDNEIYPAVYNYPDHSYMEIAPKLDFNASNQNTGARVNFLNMSNTTLYNSVEVNIRNMTATSSPAQVWYCNSSYASGSVNTNANCVQIATITNTQVANHTHGSSSQHYVIPFTIVSGKMSNVTVVTQTNAFIVRGNTGGWNVRYIANKTRANAGQTATTTFGGSWTELVGTFDIHFHQYTGNETFWYFVEGANSTGTMFNTTQRNDLLDLGGLPPSAPSVFSPTATSYTGNIAINYTPSISPNGYNISFYNITLRNSDDTYNSTLVSNNSLNLGYIWNSTAFIGSGTGSFIVRVTATDQNNQTSMGESEVFTLIPPPQPFETTATVDYNTNIGQIRGDFYGFGGFDALVSSQPTTSSAASCTLNGAGDYSRTQSMFLSTGAKHMRFDSSLTYRSPSEGTLASTAVMSDQVAFAYQNNKTAVILINGMPNWLANKTTGWCTLTSTNQSCPPTDYTKWGNLVVQYVTNVTNNGAYNASVEIEVWNEPYGTTWLNNLSNDNITKGIEYAKLYNATYWAVKAAYPSMKVGGGGGYYVDSPNMINTFLSNKTQVGYDWDFIVYHQYNRAAAMWDGSVQSSVNATKWLLSRCAAYGVSCANMYLTEWNLLDTSADIWTQNHTALIAFTYSYWLNALPQNVSSMMFKFDTKYHNATCDSTYNFTGFNQFTNVTYPSFNITKLFATNHKANDYVVNSSSSGIKIVASKESNQEKKHITIINNNTVTVNVTINGLSSAYRDVETNTLYNLTGSSIKINNINSYSVMTLESISSPKIIPFTSNPANGSNVNSKYVSYAYNITSENGLSSLKQNVNTYSSNILGSIYWYFNLNNNSALLENTTRVVGLNGLNGTIIGYGNLTYTSDGHSKGAININGQEGYIGLGEKSDIGNTTGFGISIWFKSANAVSNCYGEEGHDLFVKGYGYRMYQSSACNIVMILRNQTPSDKTITVNYGADLNWHNVALTWNSSDKQMYAYLDGLYYSNRSVENIYSENTVTYRIGGGGNSGYSFNGSIDEVIYYNKTLSANDVKSVYMMSLDKINNSLYEYNVSTKEFNQEYFTLNYEVNDSYSNSNQSQLSTYHNYIIYLNVTNVTVANIRDNFIGANVHDSFLKEASRLLDTNDDGTRDVQSNYTWHRENFIEGNQKIAREDANLGGYYDGLLNNGFEEWVNTSFYQNGTLTPPTTSKGWGISTFGNGTGYFKQSTDSKSGYSLNATATKPYSGTTGSIFVYKDIYFESGHIYNISIWMKQNGSQSDLYFQKLPEYSNFTSVTLTTQNTWTQKSIILNTSNFIGNSTYRIGSQAIYENESVLLDDFSITEDGQPYIWWRINDLTNKTNEYAWAKANNISILNIISYMPLFLANVSAECNYSSSKSYLSCPADDYDVLSQIVIDYYDRVNASYYNDTVSFEIWNEPDIGYFLETEPTDSMKKSLEYLKLYNATCVYPRTIYPNIVCGGTGQAGIYRTNLTSTYHTNFTNQPFTSFHRYSTTLESDLFNDLTSAFKNCSLYNSKNCNWVIASETNILYGGYNYEDAKVGSDYAKAIMKVMNYYPANVSLITYQWAETYHYNNTAYYPEYPSKWHMVQEPLLGLEYRPQFNITKKLGSMKGMVYNSTSSDDDEVKVSFSKSSTKCYMAVDNVKNYSQNISINLPTYCGNNFTDANNKTYIRGSYVPMSAYELQVFSSIYNETNATPTIIPDNLILTSNPIQTQTLTNASYSSQQNASSNKGIFNSVKKNPILILLIFIGLGVIVLGLIIFFIAFDITKSRKR